MSGDVERVSGQGTLFTSPDVDVARAHFAGKSRDFTSKLMSVSEAVSRFVHDGDYLVTGGFGCTRVPEAALLELIRQRRKNLGFCSHSATHNFQVLAAGRCFDRCDIGYMVGLELLGLSPNARRFMESGEVEMTEWTNACLAWRLKAGAMGIPFMPARTILGTDVFKYSAAKEIDCPFTGQRLVALPALFPDVGIIHVHRADKYGNSQIDGISVLDLEISRACKHLIITTERLVDTEEIRRDPTRNHTPYWLVDAVCHVPYGAYPSNMPYEYFSDEPHLREWVEAEQDSAHLEAFLDTYVHGTPDFAAYLALKGGEKRLAQLERSGATQTRLEVDKMVQDNNRYNSTELMVCVAARQLEDGKTAVIGTGLPVAAGMLAQRTTAPNLIIMFEAGSCAAKMTRLSASVADSFGMTGALLHGSMTEIMESCQRGIVDYAFLGGAQVDMFGNLNSSMIGADYKRPKVRLPGSGGASDLASSAWKTLILMPHDKRKFVPGLDFLTSPGYLSGPGAREKAGLPAGSGPYKVISNLALLGFDPQTKRMKVESLHPGVSKEQVVESTGFELLFADQPGITSEPTDEELRILREDVDPQGMVIRKGH